MKISRPTLSFVLIAALSACAAERAVAPQSPTAPSANVVSQAMTEVPLLYVVDGVRLQRDQVPTLTSDQIASVTVVKGHTALKEYGPDASYGVVLITTKAASAPRS
ncbi:MAG TPA: hypothetical protein VGG76_13245 [Gemmatimonadaceae bacterium]